jgi:hypothetical protein
MPDFPRQRPQPAPAIRSLRKALRYGTAAAWIFALTISANAALFRIFDLLVSR